MRIFLILAGLLVIASPVMANAEKAPYHNAAQCKAYYEKLQSKAISRLDKERQAMGMAMPMVVYSDRLSRIKAKYKPKLKRCKSLAGH